MMRWLRGAYCLRRWPGARRRNLETGLPALATAASRRGARTDRRMRLRSPGKLL